MGQDKVWNLLDDSPEASSQPSGLDESSEVSG